MIKIEKKDRIAVYTVIVGNYDVLRRPKFVDDNCDYYCITDNKQLSSDFWQIVSLANPEGLDDTRLSRFPKLMPHMFFPEYTSSFYLDPNIEIRLSINDYIAQYTTGKPMLCMKHSARDCIYDEALECIRLKKDKKKAIEKQMQSFRDEGFPEHYGLTQNSMIYRVHNDGSIIRLMEHWWNIVKNGSRRDQLSLSYVCWKQQFSYDIANEDWLNCKYFIRYNHLSDFHRSPASPVGTVIFHTQDPLAPIINEHSVFSSFCLLENNAVCDNATMPPLTYRFEHNFRFPASATAAFFGPIENHFCVLADLRAYIGRVEISTEPVNGYSIYQLIYFPTTQPLIKLAIPENASGVINLSATIYILREIDGCIPFITASSMSPEAMHSSVLRENYQNLLEQYNLIQNSTTWRLTKPFRAALDMIKSFISARVIPGLRRFCEGSKRKQS